tara:strand:- start:31 stop:579 length:549 start_codon:yes stop_codon:yes gene_type:complete
MSFSASIDNINNPIINSKSNKTTDKIINQTINETTDEIASKTIIENTNDILQSGIDLVKNTFFSPEKSKDTLNIGEEIKDSIKVDKLSEEEEPQEIKPQKESIVQQQETSELEPEINEQQPETNEQLPETSKEEPETNESLVINVGDMGDDSGEKKLLPILTDEKNDEEIEEEKDELKIVSN